MPVTTADLEREAPGPHKDKLQAIFDGCIANDEWAKRIFKKLAVLIISYPGQRAFLRACVESHKKLGYFIALTYDNYVDPKEPSVDHNDLMPDKDILDMVDLFIMPHHQTWKDVNYPYFWGVKWGVSALQDFDYIYCLDGDFVLDKPEGFEKLFSLLGDGDIMTCGPDNDLEVSSGAYIVRSKPFAKIVQYMQDHFIPFENYEKYVHLGGAEGRIRAAIRDLDLKMVSVQDAPEPDCTHNLKGTWYDLVGLRHIHGELDWAFKKRLVPPHSDYIDGKYLKPIYRYDLIRKYWDTQDNNLLEEWWWK